MSEIQAVPVEQIYRQIVDFCISEKAEIEPGAQVTLEMLPSGVHTRIEAARLAAGAVVESFVQLRDGVSVGEGAHIRYRAIIGEEAIIGSGAEVGINTHIEPRVDVPPHIPVGDFSHVCEGAVLGYGADIRPRSFIGAGVYVNGMVGPGATMRLASPEVT
ncbi:MAG: hypothetical protein QG553_594 [Patescibacteria group bacterium]|nr:hypothetical protein [Patescibacteria group bacterium]